MYSQPCLTAHLQWPRNAPASTPTLSYKHITHFAVKNHQNKYFQGEKTCIRCTGTKSKPNCKFCKQTHITLQFRALIQRKPAELTCWPPRASPDGIFRPLQVYGPEHPAPSHDAQSPAPAPESAGHAQSRSPASALPGYAASSWQPLQGAK